MQGLDNIKETGMLKEIRVVVHRLNYVFLPEIAELIATRFPFADRIVFLYFDAIGSGSLNKKRLFVNMKEIAPFLEKAFEKLGTMRERARIYHFPQCVLPESIREKAYGMTVEKKRICFGKECRQCTYFNKCPGIWKTYKSNFGLKEFKQVKAK